MNNDIVGTRNNIDEQVGRGHLAVETNECWRRLRRDELNLLSLLFRQAFLVHFWLFALSSNKRQVSRVER